MHVLFACEAVTFAVVAVGTFLAGMCGAFALADGVLARLGRPELLAGAF